MVVDKVVCERWCVTKLCVEEAGGGGGEEATRDTESKTRTPHKVEGNKNILGSILLIKNVCLN